MTLFTDEMLAKNIHLAAIKEQLAAEAKRCGLLINLEFVAKPPRVIAPQQPPQGSFHFTYENGGLVVSPNYNPTRVGPPPENSHKRARYDSVDNKDINGSLLLELKEEEGSDVNSMSSSCIVEPPSCPVSPNTPAYFEIQSKPDIEKYMKAAEGPYGAELNTILDALITGYGNLSTRVHSMTIDFKLDCSQAQCTCSECLWAE